MVKLTDPPDMSSDVYHGCKNNTTTSLVASLICTDHPQGHAQGQGHPSGKNLERNCTSQALVGTTAMMIVSK